MSGEPEPIPDSEIEAIRTLAGSRLNYEPFPFLTEGMVVEVTCGPLMGVRGRLLRKDREYRVVLSVTLIRQESRSTSVMRMATSSDTAGREAQYLQSLERERHNEKHKGTSHFFVTVLIGAVLLALIVVIVFGAAK